MKIFCSASWPRFNAAKKDTRAHPDAVPEPSPNRVHRSVLKGLSKIVLASRALVPRRSESLEARPSRPEGRGARLNRVSSESLSRLQAVELAGSPVSELDGTAVRRSTLVVSPPPQDFVPAWPAPLQAVGLDRPQVRPPDWSDKILAAEPPDGLMSDGSGPVLVQGFAPPDSTLAAWRRTGRGSDKIVIGPDDGREPAPAVLPPPVPDKILEGPPVPPKVPLPKRAP